MAKKRRKRSLDTFARRQTMKDKITNNELKTETEEEEDTMN